MQREDGAQQGSGAGPRARGFSVAPHSVAASEWQAGPPGATHMFATLTPPSGGGSLPPSLIHRVGAGPRACASTDGRQGRLPPRGVIGAGPCLAGRPRRQRQRPAPQQEAWAGRSAHVD
jgi:hypothetical protein